jgi:hypothetical protein
VEGEIKMGVVHHKDWDLSERGKKDAERHRQKIDKSIRDNVRDVISEESIITKKKGRKVRIPVRGLKDYRFIYGPQGDGAGAGQGPGKPGDIIDQKPKDGDQGKPGDQKGSDYMETEVDIDYLIDIMFEDLGLPWIEEKTKKEHLVPKGWKFETISKKGILPRLHKRRTFIEALKRTAMYVREVMDETGCEEDEANRAIIHAHGDIDEAISIVRDGKTNGTENGIYIEDDDLRFKQIEEDVEIHSNAVVIAMMDVSYSMTREKKYLARSMLFWMVEFLKKMYSNVNIKFIQHTTEAEVVDEETFFKKGTTGGTKCYTAFEKANYIIDTEYPVDEWNIYCVYISDGEDFDPDRTMIKIQEMLDKKINMLSYCEINLDDDGSGHYIGDRVLLNYMKKKWKFKRRKELGTEFYKSEENRFLLSVIKNKDHIWPCLKHQLFQPANKV